MVESHDSPRTTEHGALATNRPLRFGHVPPPAESAAHLYLLDPPETDSQPQPPPHGGRQPHPYLDSKDGFPPGQDLNIAAVKAALADKDRPIREPHRLSIDFRHSGWQHNRLLVYRSLHRTQQPISRRCHFANCGAEAYVLQNIENPTVYRIAGSSCHDRFCLPCAQERSQAIALNVLELTADREIRFLTLTLKATSQPLAAQLDHLYSSFQALRRRTLWHQKVTGGVAFLEVTWSDKSQAWHPHFHILIQGHYIPQRQLAKIWYSITGDSFVVDIRTVRDRRTAAQYVTKYASKPFNNTFLNRDPLLDEAIIAFKGRKLLLTFGTWRGITLIATPSEGAWTHVAPLETLILAAAKGDPDARAILQRLTKADLEPLYQRAPPSPPPAPKPEPPLHQLTFFGDWTHPSSFDHLEIAQRTTS